MVASATSSQRHAEIIELESSSLRGSDTLASGSTFEHQLSPNPQSSINNQKSPVPRLLSFLHSSWGWVALSVLLGVLTVGSNVGLMATSSFLISAAALHPDLGTLQVAIVGVRFFGITRGVFRYAERLASHDVTFRLLARLRTWFYRALEPLAPARLMQYRSGDLLCRIVADVTALENFYVRVRRPAAGGAAGRGRDDHFLSDAMLPGWHGHTLASCSCLVLAFRCSPRPSAGIPGADLISRRSDLQAHLVDGIQGLADLLAFGRGSEYSRRLLDEGRLYGKTQRQLAALNGLSGALTVLLVNLGMLAVLVLAIPLVRARADSRRDVGSPHPGSAGRFRSRHAAPPGRPDALIQHPGSPALVRDRRCRPHVQLTGMNSNF